VLGLRLLLACSRVAVRAWPLGSHLYRRLTPFGPLGLANRPLFCVAKEFTSREFRLLYYLGSLG